MSSARLRCAARAAALAATLFAAAFYDDLPQVGQGQLVIVLIALGCTALAMEHQRACMRELEQRVVMIDRESAEALVDDRDVVGLDKYRRR